MVFTFDIHTNQDNEDRMVPCYVITHSNYSETKFHHVLNLTNEMLPSFYIMTNKQEHFDWFITL